MTSPLRRKAAGLDLDVNMKIVRNMSTPEAREFWREDPSDAEIDSWPAWRRAGINVSQIRSTPREIVKAGEP